MESDLRQARLQALEAQLRPHFLFNALNTVSSLIRARQDQAAIKAVAALKGLGVRGPAPDLVISDYRLSNGQTGIEAIEQLRREFGNAIPAFLISGDTHSEPLHQARANGLHLLHKPVDPMTLRAMVNGMVRKRAAIDAAG